MKFIWYTLFWLYLLQIKIIVIWFIHSQGFWFHMESSKDGRCALLLGEFITWLCKTFKVQASEEWQVQSGKTYTQLVFQFFYYILCKFIGNSIAFIKMELNNNCGSEASCRNQI